MLGNIAQSARRWLWGFGSSRSVVSFSSAGGAQVIQEQQPWMDPLMRMVWEHLITVGAGERWPWIKNLTPEELWAMLVKLLREVSDQTEEGRAIVLILLGTVISNSRATAVDWETWAPQILAAHNRTLANRTDLPPA